MDEANQAARDAAGLFETQPKSFEGGHTPVPRTREEQSAFAMLLKILIGRPLDYGGAQWEFTEEGKKDLGELGDRCAECEGCRGLFADEEIGENGLCEGCRAAVDAACLFVDEVKSFEGGLPDKRGQEERKTSMEKRHQRPVGKRTEYMALDIEGKGLEDLVELLNDLGDQRWELVSEPINVRAPTGVVLLKRYYLVPSTAGPG